MSIVLNAAPQPAPCFSAEALLETVADLAWSFGAARSSVDGGNEELDSRAVNKMLIEWAREFEQNTKGVDWDTDRDYIIEVDEFFDKKYAEWAQQPEEKRNA